MKHINVYDFDKTIYDGDSTLDFYLYSLRKNLTLIRFLPLQLYGFVLYKLKIKSKEYFKEKFFSFLKGIKDVDYIVEEFWDKKNKNIKKWLINKNKRNIVIISASPEFLLEKICDKINVERLIATKVEKHTGKFLSPNCYGIEKVNRLNHEYSDYVITNFYSDSLSDQYLKEISQKAYLVKKDEVSIWT